MDLAAFAFEAEVAFANGGLAHAIDEFAVDAEFYDAIDGDDVLGVPFACAFAAEFKGHAA